MWMALDVSRPIINHSIMNLVSTYVAYVPARMASQYRRCDYRVLILDVQLTS